MPWSVTPGRIEFQLEYRRKDDLSQWAPLTPVDGKWPTAYFCVDDVDSEYSCFNQCIGGNVAECCESVGAVCSDERRCCGTHSGAADTGLFCNKAEGAVFGNCEFQVVDDLVEAKVDITALGNKEDEFEMRPVAICNEGALRLNGALVPGRVDRVPPKLFGAVQEPADGVWWPGIFICCGIFIVFDFDFDLLFFFFFLFLFSSSSIVFGFVFCFSLISFVFGIFFLLFRILLMNRRCDCCSLCRGSDVCSTADFHGRHDD